MIVIYSAILGDYDKLSEPRVPQSAEMVLFTNKPIKDYDGAWKVRDYKSNISFCRDARWLKTHPHILFPDADITIWIDGSVELLIDITSKVKRFLGNADIAMHNHNLRNCIYKEAQACIKYEKDKPEIILAQIEKYKEEGFPKDYGLVSSGILVRRNNDAMKELNELWWEEIQNGSRRDQLSFDYCRWKLDINLSIIHGSIYNNKICRIHRYHKKPDKCDVLLVKYCENKRDEKMWNDTLSYVGSDVKAWDNNKNNIGLVPARNKLLEESTSTYVCLMDFDFRGLHLDWNAMLSKLDEEDVGMVVPWTPPADINNELEWEEKKYVQCSVMLLRRSVLDEIGGLDESFNTAYGDWDLITRLWNADYKVIQHNDSFAIHAPAPKNQLRTELWKKDYAAYIDKHGESMKRREQLPRIVVADSNGTHFEWLNNFCTYLTRRGFGLQKVTGWNKDVNWWKSIIDGAAHVFLWNGAHPIFLPIIEACNELEITYSVLEVGWFPQKEYYFVDPEGINCRSTIVNDNLEWVGKRQYDKLEEIKKKHIRDRVWQGGETILVPLQLEEDMNWVLDGAIRSTQEFINHVEERFAGKDILFKKHPLDKATYKSNSLLVDRGDFLDMAQTASLVYGVNSTCLLEASLMGVPVKSIGGGYLRAHESQIQKMLAVLADKQIPVDAKNIDYWLTDILAQTMEDAIGTSEIPWSPLTNSAIVIVPCRNCEKFIGDCLESLMEQSWTDLGIIVIDDCSDDDTARVARKYLKGIDHLVIKNAKRRWALRNIDTAITSFCDNEDSVIFLLDGDDYLIDDATIEEMMRHHKSNDVVWSSYKTDINGWTHSGGMMDVRVPIRKQLWNMSPFRSFKKFLFDAIDRKDFIDKDGSYFKVTWDQAIMFPVAEMCSPEKWHFVPERFYYYRMHANNDHAKGVAEQKRVESIIRQKPSAQMLDRYKNDEVTVVVSCYNQLYVLPFFLEGMFFQKRCPKEVIIADDGSSDRVWEWIDENAHRYPFKISYLTREHDGYKLASLNNFGARNVTDGRILFTNADVIHSPNSILGHSRYKGVAGGVIVGISTPRAKRLTIDEIMDFKELSQIQQDNPSGRHNKGYIVSTNPQHNPIGVWGGNFSVPADKFHNVGGFDEGFEGWGGEDNELVRRLTSAGCKVNWVMESEGIHLDHETKKYAYDQEGSKYYIRKVNG